MKKAEYITNKSPARGKILALVNKKSMTTAELASATGLKRERIYNILKAMCFDDLISQELISRVVVWSKYRKPEPKQARELPHLTGTMRERLNLGYMQIPMRAGAMDAYRLPSGGL